MDSVLTLLIRDAFTDKATDVFLAEGEPPRIRREGEVVMLHPGPIPRDQIHEFWLSCGTDPEIHAEADVSWQLPMAVGCG